MLQVDASAWNFVLPYGCAGYVLQLKTPKLCHKQIRAWARNHGPFLPHITYALWLLWTVKSRIRQQSSLGYYLVPTKGIHITETKIPPHWPHWRFHWLSAAQSSAHFVMSRLSTRQPNSLTIYWIIQWNEGHIESLVIIPVEQKFDK